jgi:hypothetical protein
VENGDLFLVDGDYGIGFAEIEEVLYESRLAEFLRKSDEVRVVLPGDLRVFALQ